jgi:DNA-binding Lrp family transcriptional regulator
MKLLSRDLAILSAIELRADNSYQEISKLTGYRSHIVRYTLNKLLKLGVISQARPIIANEALGYFFTTLFFSLSSRRQKRKDELVEFLTTNPKVSWVFELGGDFQYGASFKVSHISEIRSFLELLSKKFGNIFFEKALSSQLSFTYFGRRYLSPTRSKKKAIVFSVDDTQQQIDSVDDSIISGLTGQDYTSRIELSRKLKIPIATFERRRVDLESRGIIKGYFHWVDPEKLGVYSFIIMVFTQGIGLALKERLRECAESESSVVYMTECMGQWDFELGVEVKEAKDITRVTEKLYDLFPEEIRSIRVIPIIRYIKVKNHSLKAAAK